MYYVHSTSYYCVQRRTMCTRSYEYKVPCTCTCTMYYVRVRCSSYLVQGTMYMYTRSTSYIVHRTTCMYAAYKGVMRCLSVCVCLSLTSLTSHHHHSTTVSVPPQKSNFCDDEMMTRDAIYKYLHYILCHTTGMPDGTPAHEGTTETRTSTLCPPSSQQSTHRLH